jgi:hypothetical protein
MKCQEKASLLAYLLSKSPLHHPNTYKKELSKESSFVDLV